METGILEDFIITRRDLFRCYESGQVSFSELVVYIWLCRLADKYGYAHVLSYKLLAQQIPLDLKGNTVGVLMRSLRNHKWIDFSDHKGSRRGFKVIIGFWPLGEGKYRKLNGMAAVMKDTQNIESIISKSQVSKHQGNNNHSLKATEYGLTERETVSMSDVKITGYKNDKKVDLSTIDNRSSNKNQCIPVDTYEPKSYEYSELLRYAELCNEKCMNYFLGKYKKCGEKAIKAMNRAEVKFKEAKLDSIENCPSFFVSLVEKELNDV